MGNKKIIKFRKEMGDIYFTHSIIVVSPRKPDRTVESAERHPRRQMESGQREMRVTLIWLGPYIRVGIGGMLGSKLFTKGSASPPPPSFLSFGFIYGLGPLSSRITDASSGNRSHDIT